MRREFVLSVCACGVFAAIAVLVAMFGLLGMGLDRTLNVALPFWSLCFLLVAVERLHAAWNL